LIVDDWSTAYYTEFSGSSGRGPRPIVVSYASSPAAEVIYADPPVDEPPTAAITGDGMCFRQVEFVGILEGTPNREAAEKWIDFMLSQTFQQDMPLQMFVFPVVPNVPLDENFSQFMDIPANPVRLDPGTIAENRDEWIQAWTELVLK
jgi:thiamine transport system substrate-binding protein